MMWIDHHLRRVGPILLVLCLPSLVVPVVMLVGPIASGEWREVGLPTMLVVGFGWVGGVGIFVALLLLTIRAFRRPIWSEMVAEDDDELGL